MTEKQGNDRMGLFSEMLGEQGMEAFRMLERMERLRRLMGTAVPPERAVVEQKETPESFGRNANENMIFAAIPFLDREYQRDLYVIVRLMEMRRVLSGEMLEARGRQEESPALRRRKLLGAVRPYLEQEQRRQLDTIVKIMDVREILRREGEV
ncbi:MAG: hypothetical protein IKI88_07905 [Anaerotignum sp.]|nr:hypothetical protein [Anaerotignum sp.]